MVDIGDGRVETWWYVLLLATLFWEAFSPEDPHCHTGEIRIASEDAWTSRIFMWIYRHIYQYIYLYFSK